MKGLLLSVLMASQLAAASPYFQEDKQQHMAVGAVIYYSCVGLGTLYSKHDINWMDRTTCWAVNAAVAIGKELWDKNHGGVTEMGDITAQVFVPSLDIVIYEW